ncbi:OmpA family protein [Flavobacterium sp.]|uniref:OmpA family protein n=1 Tax=Flavobacterium sp. TaxID=239 RepID=UPI00374CCB23
MKRLLVILFVFLTQFANAQEPDLQRAKRYFDRTYYAEAIPMYEAIVADNTSVDVVKNLADCYYYTNDLKNAQKYYRFLIKTYYKDLQEEYYFRYSQTLKASDKYDEANAILKEYYLKSANSDGLVNLEKGIKELENISAIGKRFEIKNLAINTASSEFGAIEEREKLVYAAVKNKPGLFDKVYKWNNEAYLNLVSIPLKNITSKDSIVNYFAEELNTSMHESNVIFSKDGKTIYFTRNNSKNGNKKKNKEKISNLQIFKAELVEGKWGKVTSLPFNSDNYSVEHPALSDDEKTLYFASDMPGTKGSLDIYSVSVNGESYGTPKNLGNLINTDKKEQFPFVSSDNKLYYSSNGLPGYGSLDVFVSEIKNGEYTRPLNVGLPVNSNVDDFAFNIDSDTKKGYFASNRSGGVGSDDVYSLLETKDLIIEDCKQFLAGTITDVDTKLPLENAIVLLQDVNKKEIERFTTTADGKFSFTVACEKEYVVSASKENYTEASKAFVLGKQRNLINDASLALKSLEVIKQEELLVAEEIKKKEAIAEQKKKEVEVKEKEIAEVIKQEKIEKIIAQEKDVVREKDKLVIKTDPIYFDYDLWYIRKDSKVTLKRVIELMNKYPDMILEIGSHTDMRGNDRYNSVLSEKRAQSTRDYLIDFGIAENRITAKGYGESEPIIKCESEKSCTEEQHELNRRSEFVIKSL